MTATLIASATDVKADLNTSRCSTDQEANLPTWQQELSNSTIGVGQLLRALDIPQASANQVLQEAEVDPAFPVRAPQAFLEKIERGNINDPLLRQILPLRQELESVSGYTADPLLELSKNPITGLVHKYKSRALLTLSSNCAIHCRYCFRRHFPYEANTPNRKQWQSSFDYIAANPEINEVIMSGGDPLATNDRQLRWISEKISQITSINRLRIHTRLPIVLPSRVNDELLSWLEKWPKQKVVVVHCNHPAEIDEAVKNAVTCLRQINVTVLNQSVLLKDVNDDASVLADLSEKLFEAGVLPYYLHLLDPVKGAHHFEINNDTARTIYQQLAGKISGFLLPKLVRDIPGANAKTLVI